MTESSPPPGDGDTARQALDRSGLNPNVDAEVAEAESSEGTSAEAGAPGAQPADAAQPDQEQPDQELANQEQPAEERTEAHPGEGDRTEAAPRAAGGVDTERVVPDDERSDERALVADPLRDSPGAGVDDTSSPEAVEPNEPG